MPLYVPWGAVCTRTLTISNGCPTSTCATPPVVPAKISLVASFSGMMVRRQKQVRRPVQKTLAGLTRMTRLRHVFVEALVIGLQRRVPLPYSQQETHLVGGQRLNRVQDGKEEAIK